MSKKLNQDVLIRQFPKEYLIKADRLIEEVERTHHKKISRQELFSKILMDYLDAELASPQVEAMKDFQKEMKLEIRNLIEFNLEILHMFLDEEGFEELEEEVYDG